MTAIEGLPADVARFIDDNIDSVPQLEALLILSAEPDRWWSTGELAERLYASEQLAQGALEGLRRRGLLACDPDQRCAFQPASDELRQRVADVAACYRLHLARIATFIHSKASPAVKEFARAFDLKKDR